MIEPQKPATAPLVDDLTRKMTAAFRAATHTYTTLGIHVCRCGAPANAGDYQIGNKFITNSLCIHYLACHRNEVPEDQLTSISTLGYGEADPIEDELVYCQASTDSTD